MASGTPKPSRRGRGSITIEDVAREAGVSAMTVSRVINRVPNVREQTRRTVLEIVERLNYSPNRAARDLAAGETIQLGLLYSNPSASYLSEFLIGAIEAARKGGAHLTLEAHEMELGSKARVLGPGLATAGVEGVILAPPLSESAPLLTALERANTPVVTVAMGKLHPNMLNVRIDDQAAAREMTEYLLGLGHRRIALITGDLRHIAAVERERGFRTAAKAAGLHSDHAAVEQGRFTFRSGLEAAETLLQRRDPPTAIFASNDDMASAVVSVAHRRGMVVPRDLTVVGFDDTAPARMVWPELTTVRQPISAMAAAAVDLLLAEIRHRRTDSAHGLTREIVLDHQLIVRGSSGPPKTR